MLNEKKKIQALHMPWEKEYGYAQAVQHKNTVWVSGQLGHDDNGQLLSGMENQMRQTYANIGKLLKGFDLKPDDVVEEVIYVTDMASAFEARKIVGYEFYPDPMRIASTIVVVGGLALPGQLIEIKTVARR
ncbi:RidA family protein [Flavobacterium sp.]|uniref:RidA family protein n=1 Tax=Flavobacterium sp. TaxID=239 RepID=UPI0039E69F17